MRISVVVPVRNEEQSIRALLDGLLGQTRAPDEIVITDNGSTDRTPAIVETYAAQGAPVQLIRERAGWPGRGRNVGATHATGEWLAFIDAGIRPERDWLEQLARRAEEAPGTEVVYGAWEPVTDSFFKECAAISYVPPRVAVEGGVMRPRSIASSLMRRTVWRAVGGFPENLRSAEDLLFMNEVERAGFATVYAPRAIVRWDIQPSLGRTFRRFTTYSRHNMRAGLWREWQRAVFRRYLLLAATALPALVLGAGWLAVVAALWLLMQAGRGVVLLRRNRLSYPAGPSRQAARLAMLVPVLSVLDAATFAGVLGWLWSDRLRGGPRGVERSA